MNKVVEISTTIEDVDVISVPHDGQAWLDDVYGVSPFGSPHIRKGGWVLDAGAMTEEKMEEFLTGQ